MFLQDIKIILCRPSDAGNIGAVCRAMKNMALTELRLVIDNTDISTTQSLDMEKIRIRAVHAEDILEKAKIFNNFKKAIKDCSIVIGTTRRRGQYRKNVSMTPHALAEWLAERPGPAAVVFGNERTGLEDCELELCNVASHIPVSDVQPSLNLSHAVQIYAYEFFLALKPQIQVKGEWTPMNNCEVSALVEEITDTLASLGFYRHPNREEQNQFLCDIISRAGMKESEGKYFKDIFFKAAKLGKMQNEII
jgi:tRNA/rRNA methyltransferase/tRNA (cytidine32/uridine32-2'-O)-methyltransferase